ncbi:hypothetical protein AALP_AAs39207U000100, partial [Arabis alpina]
KSPEPKSANQEGDSAPETDEKGEADQLMLHSDNKPMDMKQGEQESENGLNKQCESTKAEGQSTDAEQQQVKEESMKMVSDNSPGDD